MFITILLTLMFSSTALVLAACAGAARASRMEEKMMSSRSHQYVTGD